MLAKHMLHCMVCGRWFAGWFASSQLRKHRKTCNPKGWK